MRALHNDHHVVTKLASPGERLPECHKMVIGIDGLHNAWNHSLFMRNAECVFYHILLVSDINWCTCGDC